MKNNETTMLDYYYSLAMRIGSGQETPEDIQFAVCLIALAVFVILQAVIGYQWQYGITPMCNVRNERAPWTETVNLAVSAVFFFAVINLIVRISVSSFQTKINFNTNLNFNASLVISLMAGIGTWLTYFYDWGGTCEDAFG